MSVHLNILTCHSFKAYELGYVDHTFLIINKKALLLCLFVAQVSKISFLSELGS